jgi:hypothetical protein
VSELERRVIGLAQELALLSGERRQDGAALAEGPAAGLPEPEIRR